MSHRTVSDDPSRKAAGSHHRMREVLFGAVSAQREEGARWTPEDWLAWAGGPANVWAWIVAFGLFGILGLLALRAAAGRPAWVLAWRLTAAFLLFAGLLFVGRFLSGGRAADPWWLVPAQLGFLAVMLWAVYQSRSPGIGVGLGRTVDAALVFAALLGLCLVADDPRRYSVPQWVVFGCFAAFAAVFFYHGLQVSPESVRSRHPVWGATLFGLWLVVLPRHLPSELFLWALARLAAVATLIGMAAYVVGTYELWGMPVRFHDVYTVPIIGYDVQAMRSLFVNRNTFGILVLAGFVSAVAEFHRVFGTDRSFPAMLAPSALLVITGAGLALSYGRALWVVGVIALLVYLGAVDFGRRSVPVTTAIGGAYLLAGIVGVYLATVEGIIDPPPGNRYPLWGASVAAILDSPSWLGAGLVDVGDLIAPYGAGGAGPHNSYLSTWIRFGIVGGGAYALIVLVSLLEGLRRYRTVDVAVFAIGLAFAAHQVFESYTMFRWVIGSAIAALSLGVLVFGIHQEEVEEAG